MTGISLLLLILVTLIWIRDHGFDLRVMEFGNPPRFVVMSALGHLTFRVLPEDEIHSNATSDQGWHFAGFAAYRTDYSSLITYSLVIPYWSLALLCAILPIRWLVVSRRPRTVSGNAE
jgi:hypothetical protein